MTSLNSWPSAEFLVISLPGVFSWRLRFQKDDKLLEKEKREEVEAKIQELATKLGISKPLELLEKKGLLAGMQAQGTASLPFRSGIAMDPELVNAMSTEETEFVLSHELAHIKTNDTLWLGVVPAMVHAIMTISIRILIPAAALNTAMVISPSLLMSIIAYASFALFSRWREECADRLAFSICSDEAKKAAPLFFERMRKNNIAVRNGPASSSLLKYVRHFLITENGEFLADVLHPSLKTRIRSLTADLANAQLG